MAAVVIIDVLVKPKFHYADFPEIPPPGKLREVGVMKFGLNIKVGASFAWRLRLTLHACYAGRNTVDVLLVRSSGSESGVTSRDESKREVGTHDSPF